MKKKYKWILGALILDYFALAVLQKNNIQFKTWLANAIGVFIFSVPILVLLYTLSKDEDVSMRSRSISKIILCFWIFCYIAGAIGKAIALHI